MTAVLLAVGVGVAVFCSVRIALVGPRRTWVRARIAPHVGVRVEHQAVEGTPLLRRLESVLGATDRRLGGSGLWRLLGRLVERADVPLRPVELFYLVAGGGLLLGLLLAAATGSIALAVLAPVFTATLTHAFLVHRAARRLRAFDDQLPEFLTELSSALRVGHSLVQALRTVADDARPPIGKEVGRVLAEMSLGRPLEVALTDMSRRIPSKELDFFLTAVTIQRQVGGSLAGLFEIVAETVRQRHQFQRKLKSLIAMGKLSAWVIAAIPFGLALLLSARDHAYLAPLFRTPTGHLMLAAGVSMLALGALWLKKIVSIEG